MAGLADFERDLITRAGEVWPGSCSSQGHQAGAARSGSGQAKRARCASCAPRACPIAPSADTCRCRHKQVMAINKRESQETRA